MSDPLIVSSPGVPANRIDLERQLIAANRLLGLPPRRLISGVPCDPLGSDGWSAHYFGIQELARFAGLIPELPITFAATWTHGILDGSCYEHNPLLIVYDIRHSHDRLILVVNSSQADALAGIGYRNVRPIGAPFVYAKPRSLPRRVPGSVLLMPPLTLEGAPFEEQQQIEQYCEAMREAGVPCSGLIPPALPPRRSRVGPRTSGDRLHD